MAVAIQLRRGTSAQWTSTNPVLLEGEIGVELDTNLYKIGDGATAWNSLPYKPLRAIDEAEVILMNDQATPSVPASGHLKVYSKSIAGRMLLRQLGPSGIATPLQPSFFQNYIAMINPNTTTTVTSIGFALTTVGTISHPTVTELYGFMANFITAGTALATAGTGSSLLIFLRGTSGGGGFFNSQRLAFPDASYDETGATTGSRIFVGLTNQTMAVSVGADNPAGHYAGFQRLSVNGGGIDTNWQFVTKDGTTLNRIDTGVPFVVGKIYDFYIFCAPSGNVINWRIDNLTDGVTAEGSTSSNLPDASTLMRVGFQVQSVNAVARNVRMQRVYIEADK